MPLHMRRLLLLALLPSMASAAPPRAGGEFAVNTYTTGNQFMPDVAADGSGRFVIVWESAGQDGNQSGIFGQRFSARGTPLGSEFRINVFTTSNQFGPRVAANAAGNFVVVWTSANGQDGSGNGVVGRAYDAAGNAVSGEFPVNAYTTSDQSAPSVSVDPAGNVVVVWASDGPDGSSLGVRGRRFDASGTALGGEFPVNTFTTATQTAPTVATHADGSFVVSWSSLFQDGSAEAVIGRRFDPNGAALGGEFQVNTHTPLAQHFPRVAALGGGAFAVAWQSTPDGNVRGIFARRFDNLGNPVGGEFQVNTFTTDAQQFPHIAADPSGTFTIVWESWTQDGSQAGVFGRSFDAAGTPVDVEFRVNTYTLYSQRVPAVAADADGRFVVAWYSEAQEPGYAVRAQRFGDLIFRDGFESDGLSASSNGVTDPATSR
jgi:hypothetical protein